MHFFFAPSKCFDPKVFCILQIFSFCNLQTFFCILNFSSALHTPDVLIKRNSSHPKNVVFFAPSKCFDPKVFCILQFFFFVKMFFSRILQMCFGILQMGKKQMRNIASSNFLTCILHVLTCIFQMVPPIVLITCFLHPPNALTYLVTSFFLHI